MESPVPFGVGCYHPDGGSRRGTYHSGRQSPVPFGVGCYHPMRPTSQGALFPDESHQCLSAWGAITPCVWVVAMIVNCHLVTSAFRRGVLSPQLFALSPRQPGLLSPVPFGVGCYHPDEVLIMGETGTGKVTSAFRRGVLSPHNMSSLARQFARWGVTSAFRRGVLSPRSHYGQCVWLDGVRHQCLSAWGAITPQTAIRTKRKCESVTSAFRRGVLSPREHEQAVMAAMVRHVTSAFRRGVLSPLHPSNSLSFNCPTLPQVTSPFFIGMPSAILAPKTQPTPVTRCKSTTRVQVATCRFLPLLPRYLSAPVTINPNPCRIRPPPVSDSLSDPVSQN